VPWPLLAPLPLPTPLPLPLPASKTRPRSSPQQTRIIRTLVALTMLFLAVAVIYVPAAVDRNVSSKGAIVLLVFSLVGREREGDAGGTRARALAGPTVLAPQPPPPTSPLSPIVMSAAGSGPGAWSCAAREGGDARRRGSWSWWPFPPAACWGGWEEGSWPRQGGELGGGGGEERTVVGGVERRAPSGAGVAAWLPTDRPLLAPPHPAGSPRPWVCPTRALPTWRRRPKSRQRRQLRPQPRPQRRPSLPNPRRRSPP